MRTRDEAEFTDFAASAIRRLRRVAYLMCGDWHRAEDAAQDALVKVYRRWHRLDRGEALIGYAHRAVVTAVLDQTRRPWRRERLVLDGAARPDDPANGSTTPVPDAGDTVGDRLRVMAALAQLAPSQRACVVLRHYSDLSVEQTADILGISPGGVKSQTSRGLARLREVLDQPERIPS